MFELKNLSSLSLNSYYLKDYSQISALQYLDTLLLTNISSQADLSFLEEITTLKRLSLPNSDVDYGSVYISIYDDGVYKVSVNDSLEIVQEKVSDNPYISFIIIGEKYIYLLDYNTNKPVMINHRD